MPIPSHRAAVIAALEAAGFANRETHLPVSSGNGTFSVMGGTSVNVTAEWWEHGPEDLRGLLVRMAYALHQAGFEVHDRGGKIYVPQVVSG